MIDNHLILAIAFAIVAIINAGYLLYKSNEMNKQNEGQSHGKNLKSLQSVVILNELERIYQTAILDTVEREPWNHEYEALNLNYLNIVSRAVWLKRPQRKGLLCHFVGKRC